MKERKNSLSPLPLYDAAPEEKEAVDDPTCHYCGFCHQLFECEASKKMGNDCRVVLTAIPSHSLCMTFLCSNTCQIKFLSARARWESSLKIDEVLNETLFFNLNEQEEKSTSDGFTFHLHLQWSEGGELHQGHAFIASDETQAFLETQREFGNKTYPTHRYEIISCLCLRKPITLRMFEEIAGKEV